MRLSVDEIFKQNVVIPVLVIENLEHALPIADAFYAAGIKVLEITLRTPVALQVIEKIAQHYPDMIVGAGTVTNVTRLQQVIDSGAKFAISPGSTPSLLLAGQESEIAFIPGVATASELMVAMDAGYQHFKLFPAEASGGIALLKSLSGPFPQAKFCPTGGINLTNLSRYLALENVLCCGGSWLVTEEIVANHSWSEISELALQALSAGNNK